MPEPGLVPSTSFWDRPRDLRPDNDGGRDSGPVSVDVHTDDPKAVKSDDGVLMIDTPTGGVIVDFSGRSAADDGKDDKFDANLAAKMGAIELGVIAEQLLEGIDADERSRSEWMESRKRAIDLLGIKIEQPRSDPGGSGGAPLEGMSTVKDPVLTEAVVRGQANAIGEFLPATGPVKVEDNGDQSHDEEAEELERDFNVFLTTTATEYYPDTRRMFAWCYFGGVGIKKVYHCPLRRRPVSESVDAQNFLVSNAATDLQNADRVTHIIPNMRRSQFKRMVLAGIYLEDVAVIAPTPLDKNSVTEKLQEVEGVRPDNTRPEDQPYTIYEICCELDLNQFAPSQFKDKGVPLPYRVSIEKDSRRILEIRRHWRKDDEDCRPRKLYVKYSFIDWIGFYGLGLLHLIGNLAIALTGMLRISIDNGMFANFPGGLAAKNPMAKQETNQAGIGPGQFKPIDLMGLDDIRKAVMELPFKDVTQGILAVMQMVHGYAQRLGGTADLPIGEGKQDAPVGTTLALLEQATKVESAVHKGMHQTAAEEFGLLADLFREDPEAFWRHRKNKRNQPSAWTKEKLIAALDNYDLVPKSDPNTPSHIHRVMKAVARLQMAQGAPPGLFDLKKVYKEAMRVLGDANPDYYFAPPAAPAPPEPNPQLITAQANLKKAETADLKAKTDAAVEDKKIQNDALDRQAENQLADKKLATELVIHAADQGSKDRTHGLAVQQHGLEAVKAAHDATMDVAQLGQQQSGDTGGAQ